MLGLASEHFLNYLLFLEFLDEFVLFCELF